MQPPPDGPGYGRDPQQQPPEYPSQGGYPGGYPYPPPPQQQGYPGGYPPVPNPTSGIYGYQPPPPRGVTSRSWFWITLAAVVVIAAAVISTLVVTSGGGGGTPVGQGSGTPIGSTSSGASTTGDTSSGDTSSGDTSSSDTSSSADTSTSGAATSAVTSGGQIGRTFDVDGQTDGEKLAVTLVAIDQKAKPVSAYDKPPAGDHFVATEYRIRNIGSVRYDDAIDNCVMVYDEQNSKYAITIVQSISSGNVIDEVGLAPGQSIQGWLVYALPDDKSIASATFTPDSAIADTTLTWKAA